MQSDVDGQSEWPEEGAAEASWQYMMVSSSGQTAQSE
jgi:hypothetical protein